MNTGAWHSACACKACTQDTEEALYCKFKASQVCRARSKKVRATPQLPENKTKKLNGGLNKHMYFALSRKCAFSELTMLQTIYY